VSGVAGPCIQTMVTRVKKGKRSVNLFPASVLKRTTLEPKEHDRVHALSARVSRVALAAIASRLASWKFCAIMSDRVHLL
jgi:hypothetical protein